MPGASREDHEGREPRAEDRRARSCETQGRQRANGRGKCGVSENVMVKDDLSRDRDGGKRQG